MLRLRKSFSSPNGTSISLFQYFVIVLFPFWLKPQRHIKPVERGAAHKPQYKGRLFCAGFQKKRFFNCSTAALLLYLQGYKIYINR